VSLLGDACFCSVLFVLILTSAAMCLISLVLLVPSITESLPGGQHLESLARDFQLLLESLLRKSPQQ
jgi:hypothetical protein